MGDPALSATLRAVSSVPSLAMRRAVLDEKLFALPPIEVAAAIEGIALAAREGDSMARDAALALASAIVWKRRAGIELAAMATAAREGGYDIAARMAGEGALRALPPAGRLWEVGLSHEGYFPSRLPPDMGHWDEPHEKSFRRIASRGFAFVGSRLKPLEHMLGHPDAAFIERLLRAPWLRLRDVLRIAARRPSTPAILLAVAASDRWFCEPRVRASLAANPFTPSWLVCALELGQASPSGEHLEPVADHAL